MNNMSIGKVTSVGMQKTITVSVTHLFRHPLYKNEVAGIAVGDMVQIHETKPISKRVHFIVVSKVT